MEQERVSVFGGMAGRVLHESLGPATMLTGVMLGMAVSGFALFCGFLEAPSLFSVGIQVIFALALARFTVAGHRGEWGGSLLSSNGSGLFEVVLVAGRFLILTAIWLLPIMAIGFDPGSSMVSIDAPPTGTAVILLAIYLFASTVTPPAFLILAMSSGELAGLWRREVWTRTFSGRAGDLYLIYATYMGGLAVAFFVSVPPALLILVKSPVLGGIALGLSGAFLLGLTVNLLGRLCGFFLLSDGDRMPWASGIDAAVGSTGPGRTANGEPAAEALTPFLDRAWALFARDQSAAIALLEKRRAGTSEPRLLHALASMFEKKGDAASAQELAALAVGECLRSGSADLAADAYCILARHQAEPALDAGQFHAVAAALLNRRDWKSAANVYAGLLRTNRDDLRALNGMIRIGNRLVEVYDEAADAERLFAFLLSRHGDSELVDQIRAGAKRARECLAPAR